MLTTREVERTFKQTMSVFVCDNCGAETLSESSAYGYRVMGDGWYHIEAHTGKGEPLSIDACRESCVLPAIEKMKMKELVG